MKNNTAIILLLLAVGLFYTVTRGQYQDAKELHNLSNEYKSILQNITDIEELRDRLLITYERLPRTEIDRLNKMLPDNVDTVRIALDIDGMASNYGIAIENIQAISSSNEQSGLVVLPEYAGAYEKATISFSFVSSYDNFMNFLADLEKNLRVMDIKSISFQSPDNSNLYRAIPVVSVLSELFPHREVGRRCSFLPERL